MAACRWFKGSSGNGAFLVWERNGPGRIFGDRVAELGYRNLYYRERETGLIAEPTDAAGWSSNAETKVALLGDYRTALANNRFVNPSREAVDELGEYVFSGNSVEHTRSVSNAKEDPSGARNNHGDRVIADALAWRGALRRPHRADAGVVDPPVGSFAHRQARRRRGKDS